VDTVLNSSACLSFDSQLCSIIYGQLPHSFQCFWSPTRRVLMFHGLTIPLLLLPRFHSCLLGRMQYIRCRLSKSSNIRLICDDVPQVLILGPVQFILFTTDLILLIESHSLLRRLYGNDTQHMAHVSPLQSRRFRRRLTGASVPSPAR
jgi:hypothetical protein